MQYITSARVNAVFFFLTTYEWANQLQQHSGRTLAFRQVKGSSPAGHTDTGKENAKNLWTS
jgi:hypothetical protein